MATKKPAPVVLGGCETYREPELSQALRNLLEPLGGIKEFVKEGETILLKPNILAGRGPDHAVTTHPAIVGAITRMAVEAGAKVLVGDSPGLEGTEGACRRSGITEAVEAAGGQIITFGPDTFQLNLPEGSAFRHFNVATALQKVDGVINLAKVKTHGQMVLTLGVKNTLGCVVGMQKAQWHLRAGTSDVFSRMLLDLHRAINPRLTIIDGIVAMEGNGPFNGTAKHLGMLVASASAQAADLITATRAGFSIEEIPTLLSAGLTVADFSLETLKSAPDSVPKLEPNINTLHVGWIPFAPLRDFVRHSCTPRPDFHEDKCTACYRCVEICPADALTPSQVNKVPDLNLSTCIRCFCCQEICPVGAITVGSGLLRRIFGRLF